MLFKTAIPEGVRTNDIYAFCIGIHVLGLIGYTLVKGFKFITQPDGLSVAVRVLTTNGLQWNLLFGRLIYGAKLLYAYTFTFVVFPLVLSTLVELYVAIPAHTYINPPTGESMKTGSETGSSPTEHSIGVIQSWTLGLLYMRLSTRLVNTFYRRSRFSKAMRAVFRRGWGEPDVNVLTRAFIIPGLVMAAAAVFIPPYLCYVVEKLDAFEPVENPADKRPFQVYRYRQSYPVAFCLCFSTQYFVAAKGKFRALKVKIRDDAYLMGERLQNYDGSPVPDPRSARAAPGGGRR
jgi:E3 ubiquitin-protein ligase MARCH6